MWLKFILTGLSLTAPVFAASAILPQPVTTDFDAIVVGGGPAGLGALSALARVRRKSLLIDSAEYRNAPTRRAHDVAGFDGVTPAYYRWRAMQQISYYKSIRGTNGTVTDIRPEHNYSYFTVSMTDFSGNAISYTARKVILATGLRDILPKTPGLEENFGKGIYWCPFCDGIEHANQSLGILGTFDKAVGAAAEVTSLNKDILIFANGTDTAANRDLAALEFTENWDTYLQKRNIKVDNRTMTRITRLRESDSDYDPSLPTAPEHDLFQIDFDSGPSVLRAAMFTVFGNEQRSPLGKTLGVQMRGSKMVVDENMRTSVPGVYAVGDANSDLRTNILHALHSGKTAAVHLHGEMEKELVRPGDKDPLAGLAANYFNTESFRTRKEQQVLSG